MFRFLNRASTFVKIPLIYGHFYGEFLPYYRRRMRHSLHARILKHGRDHEALEKVLLLHLQHQNPEMPLANQFCHNCH